MLALINNFVQKDHALIQVGLHSIPSVNLFVRFYQGQTSLDSLGDDIPAFEERKQRFTRYLSTAVKIQIALSITFFVLSVLFPASRLGTGLLSCAFGAGAVSSFLNDRLLRSEIFVPVLGRCGETIKGW